MNMFLCVWRPGVVRMYMFPCVWRPGVDVWCLSQLLSTRLLSSSFIPFVPLSFETLSYWLASSARLFSQRTTGTSVCGSSGLGLQVCVCVCRQHVGVGFLLPPRGLWRWNSYCQAWHHVPLLSKSSHQPLLFFFLWDMVSHSPG